jgi:hypothetical protein
VNDLPKPWRRAELLSNQQALKALLDELGRLRKQAGSPSARAIARNLPYAHNTVYTAMVGNTVPELKMTMRIVAVLRANLPPGLILHRSKIMALWEDARDEEIENSQGGQGRKKLYVNRIAAGHVLVDSEYDWVSLNLFPDSASTNFSYFEQSVSPGGGSDGNIARIAASPATSQDNGLEKNGPLRRITFPCEHVVRPLGDHDVLLLPSQLEGVLSRERISLSLSWRISADSMFDAGQVLLSIASPDRTAIDLIAPIDGEMLSLYKNPLSDGTVAKFRWKKPPTGPCVVLSENEVFGAERVRLTVPNQAGCGCGVVKRIGGALVGSILPRNGVIARIEIDTTVYSILSPIGGRVVQLLPLAGGHLRPGQLLAVVNIETESQQASWTAVDPWRINLGFVSTNSRGHAVGIGENLPKF